MTYYKPTTNQEIKEEIQYLHNLIYSEIEWSNHIKVRPSETKLSNLYAEIAELEKRLK